MPKCNSCEGKLVLITDEYYECQKCDRKETVSQKTKRCSQKHCENHGVPIDNRYRYCAMCGSYLGDYTPKKVCVKTAVINALVFELRCLIEEESELDWASSTSCYAIRECRQALEKRIEKIREISDSQYERTCIDLQS